MSITINYFLANKDRFSDAEKLTICGVVKYSFTDANGPQVRRFKFSTQEKCRVGSFKNGKVKHQAEDANHINGKLQTFRKDAEKLYRSFEETKHFPTPQVFRTRLLSGAIEVVESRQVLSDFQQWIEYQENKGNAPSRIKSVKQTFNKLTEFNKKYPIDYSNINLSFYGKFKKFCSSIDKETGSKGLKPNTFGSHIKIIKTFLNFAKAEGWNKYDFYKHQDFKIVTAPVPVVSLQEEEVMKLAELDLTKRPQLALNRDYFVLGCETGLRYSDYVSITKDNIKEVAEGYNLEIKTQKTDQEVIIPLSNVAMDILSRYDYQLPKPPTNQKLNENLKVLSSLAKIDKEVSTHTARRTFATIQYEMKTPIQWIMKITGHKTEREFYKYIGVDLSKNADKVRELHGERYKIEKKGLTNRTLKIA